MNSTPVKKRSLFDKSGKIQISSFDPNLIRLDAARIREISDRNSGLEGAEVITQEVLQLEFSI